MNDYLVSQLKNGRLKKGLKQSDVSQITGIKNTTLSNYENGVTEPDIDTFLALCELYELDFVSLIEEAYGIDIPGKDFHIKPSEMELIKKYRTLNNERKTFIDDILNREHNFQIAEGQIGINPLDGSKMVYKNCMWHDCEKNTHSSSSSTSDKNLSTSPSTIAAHFDGDEYTDEELNKIKEFTEFVKSNKK